MGIKSSCDTFEYQRNAELILSGKFPTDYYVLYSFYSILLALSFWIWSSFQYVVVFQILFSFAATILLTKLCFHYFKSKIPTLFVILSLILWTEIHFWDFFLYTESIFTSLSIILLYLVYFQKYKLATFVALLVIFTRPNGCLLIASILFSWFYFNRAIINQKLFWSMILVFTGSFLYYITQIVSTYNIIESYAIGEIIYPKIPLIISAPKDLIYDQNQLKGTFFNVIQFMISNPLYIMKLFIIKFSLYYLHIKPYFSFSHNMLIMTFLYPIYMMAILGFVVDKHKKLVNYLSYIFIIISGISIGLTSENWDGRFLVPVLPFIFFMAGQYLKIKLSNFIK